MKSFLHLLLTLLIVSSQAQELRVKQAKQTRLANGEKVKSGETLPINSTVKIKERGVLLTENTTGWGFKLYRGEHSIDSIYSLKKTEYHAHDSIYNVLVDYGIANCDFSYDMEMKPIEPRTMAFYEQGHIQWDVDGYPDRSRIDVSGDFIDLEWSGPSEKLVEYFVVVRNIFETYQDVIKTEFPRITLNLAKYGDSGVLLQIISTECRESDFILISRQ